MTVNICGIPHKIVECDDAFNSDALHWGQIEYAKAIIKVNKDLSGRLYDETIAHEMVHGILVHLGYDEQSQDEQFVQALANAIVQGFDIKYTKEQSK